MCIIFPVRHTFEYFTEFKAHTRLDTSPETLLFYGIILKTLDKSINPNPNVLDYWLLIYWLLYIDPCVNIGVWYIFCRISTLKWIVGIKVTNNLFRTLFGQMNWIIQLIY